MRTGLVFQTTDTDTCEEITDESFVIDVAAISADDAAVLDTCDHYGVLTDQGRAIVRTIGVPVSELWAAYKWRESLAAYGILDDVERYVESAITDDSNTCRYCDRTIVRVNGRWIDPEATGDDSLWKETCDGNDTFMAEHAPDDDDQVSAAYDRYRTVD